MDRWEMGCSETRLACQMLHAGDLVVFADTTYDGQGRAIMAGLAAKMNAASVNVMTRLARGVISLSLDPETVRRLNLSLQSPSIPAPGRPWLLKTIEAATCKGTGISAYDRAETIRAAADPCADASALVTPGHILPNVIRGDENRALCDRATQWTGKYMDERLLAWADILDDAGNVASYQYCRTLAEDSFLVIPLV